MLMKNKLKKLCRLAEFRICLFIFFLLLFLWPMIAVPNLQNVKLVFYWLYISWFALIAISFSCDILDCEKPGEDNQ